MGSTTTRRTLRFANLDEMVAEVERLHQYGYTATGKWDLAQISLHLNDWMRYPMDGYPVAPWYLRSLLWVLRVTQGKKLLRELLAGKPFPEGNPTMNQSVHPSGLDEAESVATLKRTVERWKAYSDPLQPSPLFGQLDKDDAEQLQLIHCAHHLSFLVPNG